MASPSRTIFVLEKNCATPRTYPSVYECTPDSRQPRINNPMSFLQKFVKNSYKNFGSCASNTKIMDVKYMMEAVRACIPSLDGSNHKGSCGRIGVVGGSLEYTGAPYFAGISALKVGADLVHIFCASSAASVIKSYSPELIVHPLLDRSNAVTEISPWLNRLHAVVIGPGLGIDPNTLEVVSQLIRVIRERKLPLVIDADGLFLITENPELIQDFPSPVVLTPNKVEFQRLCNKVKIPTEGTIREDKLGRNVTILRKGPTDEVMSSEPDFQWTLNDGGSGRRCGGQGDLLSGSIAIFLHWMMENHKKAYILENINAKAASLACYAASKLVRRCNEKAFKIKGRSMLASDMIEHIHESFEELFGEQNSSEHMSSRLNENPSFPAGKK